MKIREAVILLSVSCLASPSFADRDITAEEYDLGFIAQIYDVEFGSVDEGDRMLRVSLALVWDEYQVYVEELRINDGTGNRGLVSGYRIRGDVLADLFQTPYVQKLRFVQWDDAWTFVLAHRQWNGYYEYTETFVRFTYVDDGVFYVRAPNWTEPL